MARFVKGQSGNPNGGPKARRPNLSAFDIIFDKRVTVSQNGVERELSVDEVLQLKTYQAAITGNRPAVRQVIKMIEKRERALAVRAPASRAVATRVGIEDDPRNADAAMLILGITVPDPQWQEPCAYGTRMKLATWAAQAGISRPGRQRLTERQIEDVKRQAIDPIALKWPRGATRG